jgi:hypothetical protein
LQFVSEFRQRTLIVRRSKNWKHIVAFFLLFGFNVNVFLIAYFLKRQFLPARIIFFEGCGLALIVGLAGALAAPLVNWWRFNLPLAQQWLSAVFAALLFDYAFVSTIPTILDRSVSLVILAAVDQAGEVGATVQELSGKFLDVYVDGEFQVRKRIDEQIASGNFSKKEDRVYITSRGQFLERVIILSAQLFNIDKRSVLARK